MKLINLALFLMIVTIICISLFTGSAIYKQDKEDNITRDIYNYTESNLLWNDSLLQPRHYNASLYNTSNKDFMRNVRINNIIFKIANTMGYSTFEFTKLFVEIGYNSHGEYNLGFFLTLINAFIWIVMISVLFFPAMAISVALYELYKWIRRYLNKRKEKEELQNE